MNSELDQRLKKLKTTEPGQYKAEMSLQQQFNTATDNFDKDMMRKCVGRECEVLCSFTTTLDQARYNQAQLINRSSLSIEQVSVSEKVIGAV